ncbi:MAG: hypothetical protein IKI75_05035 [Lachnospiraceae bacterium]|nr:hypothetical protein [Lachnospiraceae bacterium]
MVKNMETENKNEASPPEADIPGIDPAQGILNSGGPSLFTETLGDVHDIIDDKCAAIEKYLEEGDLRSYTTQVHALKTTCRMIGAMELGERFFTLEKLGNENDRGRIAELTPGVLSDFRALKPYLEPYSVKKSGPDRDFDREQMLSLLSALSSALEEFELTAAGENMEQLCSFRCSDEIASMIQELDTLVSGLDYDEALQLAKDIIDKIQK